MQLIPAIDLLGDDAVRLEQGDYDRVIFRQPLDEFLARVVSTGPDLIHVVDLQGARDGVVRTDLIARCVRLAGDIPLQVSGGIRSLDVARAILATNVQRVILGTALWSDPDALARYADDLGEQLVVALDVRDGVLSVKGWRSSTGVGVDDALARCRDAGVTRLHVTAIARDGTMSGPDLDLYARVCASGLRVVAAGGVRDDRDLLALDAVGCEAAVMGVGFLARLGIELSSPSSSPK
jgi:phosphoribosylformimino-5-aminoimidazole carboxamide ribotide isomerase